MDRYEEDLSLVMADVSAKMEDVADSAAGDKRRAIEEASSSISDAEEIIGQMELEAINCPPQERHAVQARIRQQRSSVHQWKKELARFRDAALRQDIFAGRSDEQQPSEYGSDAAWNDQRSRLLQGTRKLEESSERLRNSQRVANETEGVGAAILNDLYGQREQILHARDQLFEADGYLDRSIRTIRTMARRMISNRLLTYAIIAILVLLILLVLYGKLFR